MQDLRKIFRYARPVPARSVRGGGADLLLNVSFEMVIPVLMSTLVDDGVPAHNMAVIFRQGGLMICARCSRSSRGCCMRGTRRGSQTGSRQSCAWRKYAAVQKFDFATLDRFSDASPRHPYDHRCHGHAQRRQRRSASAGAQPGHALHGAGDGLRAQPAADDCIPRHNADPGRRTRLDRHKGRPALWPPAERRGSPEWPHPRVPDRHPRHQGVRPRRLRERPVRHRQHGIERCFDGKPSAMPSSTCLRSRPSCIRPSSASFGSAAIISSSARCPSAS